MTLNVIIDADISKVRVGVHTNFNITGITGVDVFPRAVNVLFKVLMTMVRIENFDKSF